MMDIVIPLFQIPSYLLFSESRVAHIELQVEHYLFTKWELDKQKMDLKHYFWTIHHFTKMKFP